MDRCHRPGQHRQAAAGISARFSSTAAAIRVSMSIGQLMTVGDALVYLVPGVADHEVAVIGIELPPPAADGQDNGLDVDRLGMDEGAVEVEQDGRRGGVGHIGRDLTALWLLGPLPVQRPNCSRTASTTTKSTRSRSSGATSSKQKPTRMLPF